MHVLPPALQETSTLAYTLRTQGVKQRRYSKETIVSFNREVQREHSQQQEGNKWPWNTETGGIQQLHHLKKKNPGSQSDPGC